MTYGVRPYGSRAYGDSSLGGVAAIVVGGGSQTLLAGGVASAEVVGLPAVAGRYTLAVLGADDSSDVGRPNVFVLGRIYAGSVLDAPAVGAPWVYAVEPPLPAGTIGPPRIRVRLADRLAPTVPVLELDEGFGRSWQDVHNDAGAGRIVVQNDDPDLASVDYFDVLRFELDGVTRFAALVERKARATVAGGEEADEATELSGRGVVALLEDGVVFPEGGPGRARFSETRVFNFASPSFDDSGWTTPVASTQTQMEFSPEGWPDPDAVYLWDRYSAVDGTPPGDVYLRHNFNVPADDTVVEVWIDVDDEFELWLDGQPLVSDTFNPLSLGVPEHPRLKLDAGDHLLALRARNLNDLKAGVILSVLELDAAGVVVGTLTNTAAPGWRAVGYPPSPPGFTPGRVLRVLLEETQARGALAGVTLSFTDGADSAGRAWPVAPDLAFPVGTDLLSVLKQIAESYLDFKMTPNLVLHAWATRGTTTTVAFEPGVNVTELFHEGKV